MIDELASYLDDMRIPYVRGGEHDLVIDYYNDPHPVAESMDGTFIVSGCTVEQVADAVSNAFDVFGTVSKLSDENKSLKDLVLGLLVCGNDSLDAREWCPLYDEEAPNRCRMDGLLERLVPISAKFEKPRAHRPLDGLEDA